MNRLGAWEGRVGAEELAIYVAKFSYPLVFALLVACGVGAPLSEDLIAVSAGLVTAKGEGSLPWMIATVYLGTLAGDSLIFRIGARLGPKAAAHRRIGKLLTPARMGWVSRHFQRYGVLTVLMARFTPGLRMPTFLTAGASGMRYRTFLAVDAGGALVTASLFTFLGFRFGSSVLDGIRNAGGWILIAVALVAGAWLIQRVRKGRRARWASQSMS